MTRGGFALFFSMLLVLVLSVLALGLMATGTREVVIAEELVRRLQAQRLAEAAALAVFEAWSTRAVSDLPIGEGRDADVPGPGTATIERLDSGLFLVRGLGQIPGPQRPATATAGLLVRVLPPEQLMRLFPGAVTADTVGVTQGVVDASDTICGGGTGVRATVADIGPGATVTGNPPVRLAAPPRRPVPDPFGPALLAQLTALPASGTVTPRPTSAAGACAPDGANWGSLEPEHPCYDLLPLVTGSGLTVAGGEGRGVLVVDGDVHVTDGARLAGVVVVRGQLVVDRGAVIRGAVRAGRVQIAADGAVQWDGCALSDAVSAPALDRGFRPPSRWWIPLF